VTTTVDELRQQLTDLDAAAPEYATRFVERMLAAAQQWRASDVHLTPTPEGLLVRWRLDGVLHPLGTFPLGDSASVVARLKVLSHLLTYRSDVPQEGRIREGTGDVEMRVSTFPTLHGERAVVRLFAAEQEHLYLEDLGLPADVHPRLQRLLDETSGAILITGPAGSGKTTTAYACLRQLVRHSRGGRNIVSLEDPIEVAVPGVAQSQVNDAAGFDLVTGLRSLMRQDPEVIFVGEIRDRITAEVAFQAALTGQLVLTTFHAGSAAGAVSRLGDMEIQTFLLRTGILGIMHQRLLRKLCDCARQADDEDARLALPVARARVAAGCATCGGTGYRGRLVIAEMLVAEPGELSRAVLSKNDAGHLEKLAVQAGMVTRWQRACAAVESGATSAAEVRRVLGWGGEAVPAPNRE
jgi:type II secretory ATPase GspE/PulE/Tfp pilus assembly ATPase PilB-like protein